MRWGASVASWGLVMSVLGLAAVACGDLVPLGAEAPPPPASEPNDPSFPGEDPPDVDPLDVPLEIRSLEPTEGPVEGGFDVMITGRGLEAGLEVFFDQTPAVDVVVVGPTVAIVKAPPHPAGRVDVAVAHRDHEGGAPETLPGGFRYVGLLQIDRLEPDAGRVDGGEPVTVHGRGFTPDTIAFVGGRPLIAHAVADEATITGVTPPGRWGPADVHVVGINGTAARVDGFLYGAPPRITRLTPIVGEAGTRVVIEGEALGDDTLVSFGEAPAEVRAVAFDGSRLEVVAPEAAPGAVVDVRVQGRWGVDLWPDAFGHADPAADPMVLACTHLAPARGPEAGGTTLEIACRGLAYPGLTVSFGGEPGEILATDALAGRLVVRAPPGQGQVVVRVASAVAATDVGTPYTYEAAPTVAVTSITPAQGTTAGGTPVVIRGEGFASGAAVQIGALAATGVRVIDATTIEARTPPGAPGGADVIVHQSGVATRLVDGFAYRGDELALSLVTPPTAARAGGTYLRVYGDGFGDDTTVAIGGAPCEIIRRVSPAELHVRSPHIEVGTWDAVVTSGAAEARLERALTIYDPRSGYGGTWGDPIDETLNVTVWGSGGYGAVAGAFVIIDDGGADPVTPRQGVTDENGQLTLSGPGLYGPVEVTASRAGFTSYSVVVFDATNLTIILQQNPVPPPPQQGNGSGDPPVPPPTARIRGQVTGLGKYVVAPPASCEALAIAETDHCRTCGDGAAVPQCSEGFACVETGTGEHCVAACGTDADCPTGYRCGATTDGARCLPSSGVPAAYCNVSSTSLFGYEYPIQATGWVDAEGRYDIDAMRIGEVAIYCVGGYRSDAGLFTPTIMGVRRHLFAGSGQVFEDVDIALDHPLERSFRLRIMDPPPWSTGLQTPQIIISLDLGADGVIPFSRTLVPGAGDLPGLDWIAPRQLVSLSRELYDGQFFFYTTLAPNLPGAYQPRAYNLVQNVTRIVEDRFPVRDPDGRWRLEGTQLERDLLAVWASADGSHAFAVGEAGTILGRVEGAGWTRQTSYTEQTLRAIAGSNSDLWAVGDGATVRRWDGLAWTEVAGPGPSDTFHAVAVSDGAVLVAGDIRLRRYDRASGAWSVVGGPALQQIRGLASLPDGRVLALGTSGRAYVTADGGETFSPVTLPGDLTATLRAARVTSDGALVVVGDAGTILIGEAGAADLALEHVASPTPLDLAALTETAGGDLVIVGDHGTAIAWARSTGGAPWLQTIDDYRSKAHGVFVSADGRVRVVGSAAFILGPFLHFPVITSPVHDATADALELAWAWSTGPASQYTQLRLIPDGMIAVWTLIVEGDQMSTTLPDLEAAAGIAALPTGRIRFEVLRVLNRNFSIDGYTTREFSIYARDSWSTNEAYFYLP
ncbi:MAG: IPT/TIG domain-containing protein [Deltaproteobacteria bacterium]|nr:IPT/TIG domain-containing protein [Deltaproteobacteria bacterium]